MLPLANAIPQKLPPPLPPPIEVNPHYLAKYLRRPMEEQKRRLPPPEYDHEYDGEIIVLRATEPEVRRHCYGGNIKPGHMAIGCAEKVYPKKCTLLIVHDEELKRSGYDYDIVYRHERGHCNSWRHDFD